MQSWIGQLRVLWERLMTLVYFLEEGKDPRGKLSIRKQFFRGITSWGGRWDVFAEWESFIDQYDKLYTITGRQCGKHYLVIPPRIRIR